MVMDKHEHILLGKYVFSQLVSANILSSGTRKVVRSPSHGDLPDIEGTLAINLCRLSFSFFGNDRVSFSLLGKQYHSRQYNTRLKKGGERIIFRIILHTNILRVKKKINVKCVTVDMSHINYMM